MINGLTNYAGQLLLGPLEIQVMEVLWNGGERSVRDVAEQLDRKLAYTTVMTTLDRCSRRDCSIARNRNARFLYTPRISHQEWERQRAGDLVAGLLAGSQPSRELLLSSLVDAVGQHDVNLLEQLEEKIRRKRKELSKRNQG